MRVAYADTSCLVAIEFGEPAAADVIDVLATFDRVFASNLLESELRAACAREGVTEEPASLAAVSWVLPNGRLSTELERVFAAGALNGADAWHLACALLVDPSASELVFLTLDVGQGSVARRLGFTVVPAARARRRG